MTTFEVDEEVIAIWGKKRKEYNVKIARINDDGKTVKILWDEKTKEGNILVSSKFLITNLKKIGADDDPADFPPLDLFPSDDPDNAGDY